jgi:hypothetical protein
MACSTGIAPSYAARRHAVPKQIKPWEDRLNKSTPPQKPELFSAAQPADGSRRILASLENSGKANTPGARLARLRPGQLVMILTLLAVVAAGIASISYVGMAPARYSQPLVPSAPQVPLVAEREEVERRAAAIVNEPLPAIAAARHKQSASGIATVPAQGPRAGAAPLAAQAKVPPATAVFAATAAAADAAPQASIQARPATHAERGLQARPRQVLRAAAAGPTRLAAATTQQDSDVTLLAALVAHSGAQPSAILHTRDVVERTDGDSTDALLRRCQRLGGAEAGLCRARICNGLWLHEAACRAPVSD